VEEQKTQPGIERTEQESSVEDRQPWVQPTLEQLHVSLDTAFGGGSATDGITNNPGNLPPG